MAILGMCISFGQLGFAVEKPTTIEFLKQLKELASARERDLWNTTFQRAKSQQTICQKFLTTIRTKSLNGIPNELNGSRIEPYGLPFNVGLHITNTPQIVEDVKLQRLPIIDETLDFMISNIKNWVMRENQIDQMLVPAANKLSDALIDLRKQNKFSPHRLLELSYAFSILSRLQKDVERIEFRVISNEDAFKAIVDIVDQKPVALVYKTTGRNLLQIGRHARNLILPTKRSLSFTTLLDAWSYGVLLAQVTTKSHLVDGSAHDPLDFFNHDLEHAAQNEQAEADTYTGVYAAYGRVPPERNPTRQEIIAFRKASKDFAFSPHNNERKSKLIEAIFFLMIHEGMGSQNVFHPTILRNSLVFYLNNPDGFQSRLSDDTDLGQAFAIKPEIEEIVTIIKDIMNFLNGYSMANP